MTLTFTDGGGPEPGVYDATLIAIDEDSNEHGDYRRWTFSIELAGGAASVELRAFSTMASGPRSKAYTWASTLLGAKPTPGQPVELVGRRCRVVVVTNDEGFARIDSLLPPTPAGASSVNLGRLDAEVYPDAPPSVGF